MRAVVGIDAGGTFTDCVVIDADDTALLHHAKTLTTPDDLTGCLSASIAAIPEHLIADVTLVCLSTTLATNAIVEGHGCRAGLILIGSRPTGALPTARAVLVRGKYDLKGRLVERIDPDEVLAAVESLRHDVDAIAVSGYASVRCPEHELFVKAVVEDRLGVPVVCAHELTTRLGHYERTVTAVLNARLTPLTRTLMDSARAILADHGVDAPLMIVRGDGTLMAEGLARNRPIETILSGPAASAVGAVHLTGRADCFVMDIGGTTTDIAHVAGGRLTLADGGAHVGDWAPAVRGGRVVTVGLGGDSRIHLDSAGRLTIGPRRSIGFARAAARHPRLTRELEELLCDGLHLRSTQPAHEAFVLAGRPGELSANVAAVLEALRDGPHTRAWLARTLSEPGLPGILGRLTEAGVLHRVSLTPTDLWHATRRYTPGDVAAAELALRLTAERHGVSSDELAERVQRHLGAQLESSVARAARSAESQDRDPDKLPTITLRTDRLTTPVVAIGAPTATWLDSAWTPSLFTAEIPEHADVAGAVGAAVAHAVDTVELLIRPDTVSGRFLVFSPQGRESHGTLEEATAAALNSGQRYLRRVTGRGDLRVESRIDDVELGALRHDGAVFVERLVLLHGH